MANNSIRAAFERMWQHITLALSGKADKTELNDYATKEDVSNIVFQCYSDTFSLGNNSQFTPLSSTIPTPTGKTAADIFMMNFVDTNGIIYTAVRKTTTDLYGSGEFRFSGTGAVGTSMPKIGWGTLRLGLLKEANKYYTVLENTYCATVGTGGTAVTTMNLSGTSQIIIYYK